MELGGEEVWSGREDGQVIPRDGTIYTSLPAPYPSFLLIFLYPTYYLLKYHMIFVYLHPLGGKLHNDGDTACYCPLMCPMPGIS